MEEVVEVNGIDMLYEVIALEHDNITEHEIGSEEHQKAFNNFIKAFEVLNEVNKMESNAIERENDRTHEKEINDVKNAHEKEINDVKNMLDRERMDLDSQRLEFDREVEMNRKDEAKYRKYLEYAENGIKIAGLLSGTILTFMTLKVNMESVITDRDAVSAAKKIHDFFAFGRK